MRSMLAGLVSGTSVPDTKGTKQLETPESSISKEGGMRLAEDSGATTAF